MNIEELKIHFFYLVTLLTFALIIVSTGLWTDKENFTTFLTNAATMISIVLGLVAIFYSFISNTSLSQSLGNITTVSNGVEKSNQLVNQFVAQAEQLNRANLQNSEKMTTLSLSVDEQLNSLTTLLKELDNKSTSLQATVSTLPTKLESLEIKFLEGTKESSKASETENNQSAIHFNSAIIKRIFDSSAIITVFIIYACQVAYKKKVTLDLKKIQPFTGVYIYYLMGIITTYSSLWLLDRDWVSDETDTYLFTVGKMDESLASFDIESYIANYLKDSNILGEEKSRAFSRDFERLKEYLASLT